MITLVFLGAVIDGVVLEGAFRSPYWNKYHRYCKMIFTPAFLAFCFLCVFFHGRDGLYLSSASLAEVLIKYIVMLLVKFLFVLFESLLLRLMTGKAGKECLRAAIYGNIAPFICDVLFCFAVLKI